MIYTSYFGNIKNVPNPIAIVLKSPSWYMGPEFKKLAPKFWFFDQYKKEKINGKQYIDYYYSEVLDLLLPFAIEQELKLVYNDEKDFTLLCYEKPEDFCHRHIVSKWFNDNGIEAAELINIKIKKEIDIENISFDFKIK